MPIVPLPHTTVRAIGSMSVISDPCSVVKELLDNALDASASSVVIEISQNTIDIIQVRDNGYGIATEDHAVLCKRSFTSKIKTVDDLRNVGGRSLGFRGEALASAAEMSGGLAVTTRVESEVAGSLLKYGRDGKLTSSQRASHPVGTTVRIMDFLKHIPVRRQTALKSAAKTLTRIKKLLHAYAIAQPSKRLSFKVLRAKNESNNWVYAPGRSATLMDAALKVAGADVASSCITKEWPADLQGQSAAATPEYHLVACLAKSDADFSKVNNEGQFVSVDGRPLSTARGIAHDITKLYKSYLRSAALRSEQTTSAKDPFLCLQIRCPRGSYDVNVEPAKDDILFEDAPLLLSMVEDLFRDIYGELETSARRAETSSKGKEKLANNDDFELLMARKRPVEPIKDANQTLAERMLVKPQSKFKSPLPADHHRNNVHDAQQTDVPEILPDKTPEFLNPWAIARLNGPARVPDKSGSNGTPPVSVERQRQKPFIRHGVLKDRAQQSANTSFLPSPPSSNPTSTSPIAPRNSPLFMQPSCISPVSTASSDAKKSARERDRERYGRGALDTWFVKTTQASLLRDSTDGQREPDQEEMPLSQRAQERFGLEQPSSIATNCQPQDASTLRRPFVDSSASQLNSPVQPLSPQPTNIRNASEGERRQEFPVLERWSATLHRLPDADKNADLEDALDFERRKREAMQKRREQMRGLALTAPKNDNVPTHSPHRSRYLAARAALSSDPNSTRDGQESEANSSVSAMSKDDPRAYLIRHQSAHGDGTKVRRQQTSKLPLERIPEGNRLYDVGLIQPADLTVLSNAFSKTFATDLYMQAGKTFEAFHDSDVDDSFGLWESRLLTLMKDSYMLDGPHFDFPSIITKHVNEYNEASEC